MSSQPKMQSDSRYRTGRATPRILFVLTIAPILFAFIEHPAGAQPAFDSANPFGQVVAEQKPLLDSDEIVMLYGTTGPAYMNIFNATNSNFGRVYGCQPQICNGQGLQVQSLGSPARNMGGNAHTALVGGDFVGNDSDASDNGDEEIVAAWISSSRVHLFGSTGQLPAGNLGIDSNEWLWDFATSEQVPPRGVWMTSSHPDYASRPRTHWIGRTQVFRVASGDVDKVPNSEGISDDELIVVQRIQSINSANNNIRIIVLGMNSSSSSTFSTTDVFKRSYSTSLGDSPSSDPNGCGLSGGSQASPAGLEWFDVVLADVDGDRDKEIAIAYIGGGCEQDQEVRVAVFDVDPDAANPISNEAIPLLADLQIDSAENPIVPAATTGSEYVLRTAIASQDLDGDGRENLVVAYSKSILHRVNEALPLEPVTLYGRTLSLSNQMGAGGTPRSLEAFPDPAFPAIELMTSAAGAGGTFDLKVTDLVDDVRPEVLLMYQDRFLMLGTEQDGTLGRDPVDPALAHALLDTDLTLDPNGGQIANSLADISHDTFLVADIDAEANPVLAPELVILRGIRNAGAAQVYAYNLSGDAMSGYTLAAYAGAETGPDTTITTSIAAINVDHDGPKLGAPTGPPVHVEDIIQPVAYISAPPLHLDSFTDEPCWSEPEPGNFFRDSACFDVAWCWRPGVTSNYDPNCEFLSEYTLSTTQTMEVTAESMADWSVSKSIVAGGTIPVAPFASLSVEASLNSMVGGGFSNLSGTTTSTTVTQTIGTTRADRVIALETSYDIYEYPVLSSTSETIGFVSAVVPSVTSTIVTDPNNLPGFKGFPNHQIGNVLSYKEVGSTFDIDDFGSSFLPVNHLQEKVVDTNIVGDSFSVLVNETTVDEQSQFTRASVGSSISASLGVEAPFGAASASISASLAAEYSSGSVSTAKVTLGENSEFNGQYDELRLDPPTSAMTDTQYSIKPYLYWNSDGAIVLDYAVGNLEPLPASDNFWSREYGAPDLTIVLPWRSQAAEFGAAGAHPNNERTRDIAFDPPLVARGDTASIYARVQNYGMMEAAPSTASFYLFDYDGDGIHLGDVSIPGIPARDQAIIRLDDWAVPWNVDSNSRVYVVLDSGPVPTNVEVHEDNNIAWAPLSPVPIPEPTGGLWIGGLALAWAGAQRRESRSAHPPRARRVP